MVTRALWQKRISITFGVYSAVFSLVFVALLLANRAYTAEIGLGALENLITVVSWSVLATLLTYHRPENRIGWLLMAAALLRQSVCVRHFAKIVLGTGTAPTIGLYFWRDLWFLVSGLAYGLFAYLFVLFPTGRLPSPRWRLASWLLGLQAALSFGAILSTTIARNQAIARATAAGVELPPAQDYLRPAFYAEALRESPALAFWLAISIAVGTILVLTALWSQVVRYRGGNSLERQQIKWVIFAMAVWLLALFPFFFMKEISQLVVIIMSPLLPSAIAVPILRYRLYDIDLIIRRTFVYGALTGLLALVYLGSVTLLQSVVAAASDQQSPVAIVVSTLLIAALFAPLRRRVQAFIDRRFYRRKYDAERILSQFSRTVRDEVDLDRLAAELLGVVDRTMRPESVSLWLKER